MVLASTVKSAAPVNVALPVSVVTLPAIGPPGVAETVVGLVASPVGVTVADTPPQVNTGALMLTWPASLALPLSMP
jgi:hypothetical protein